MEHTKCNKCGKRALWAYDKIYKKWLLMDWETPVFRITRDEEKGTQAEWAQGYKIKHTC